jgi:hypothetical protein
MSFTSTTVVLIRFCKPRDEYAEPNYSGRIVFKKPIDDDKQVVRRRRSTFQPQEEIMEHNVLLVYPKGNSEHHEPLKCP